MLPRSSWSPLRSPIPERWSARCAELDPSVEESLSDKRVTVAEVGKPVYAGSRLVTKNPGRLFVNFEDRWAAKLWENSELWLTTNIRTEDGFAYKHQLRFGQIRVLIKEGQHVSVAIKTDAGTAITADDRFHRQVRRSNDDGRVSPRRGHVRQQPAASRSSRHRESQ